MSEQKKNKIHALRRRAGIAAIGPSTFVLVLVFFVSTGARAQASGEDDADFEIGVSADGARESTPAPVAAPSPAGPIAEPATAPDTAVREEPEPAPAATPAPDTAERHPAESREGPREAVTTASLTPPWWQALDLRFSGYAQVDFQASQASVDEIQQGGAYLNQDRFVVRRARARIERHWRYAAAVLELDANTTRGPAIGARRIELTARWPGRDDSDPPRLALTAGLTEIPFGAELTTSHRLRFFTERSTGSLAFFRGEPDVGVRVHGGLGPFRYAIALMNGQPVDDRNALPTADPNRGKDVLGRVGIDVSPSDAFSLRGGVSALVGRGFHAGTEATKNDVAWRDLDENGAIGEGELTAIPGRAATPSASFSRWAINADLAFSLRSPLGWSHVSGEVTMAQNLDRGLVIADPIAAGRNLRELAWHVSLLHEILDFAAVGVRVDFYDPDADLFDARRGRVVPFDASITTFSPLIALVLPGRARLIVQYDHVVDTFARDVRGVPTDARNDVLTVRAQGEL